MESMRWQQQPLPCEVADVSTAVFDGADAVMLTSATSIGINPVQVSSSISQEYCHASTQQVTQSVCQQHAASVVTLAAAEQL